MTHDDTANLIYSLLLLVLVGSALAARRLPLGHALKMALGWVAIFAVGFTGFAFRDEFTALGQRLMLQLRPERGQTVGHTLRVPVAADGHFWVEGLIGDRRVRFLIDSGASTTALSDATAAGTGVTVDRESHRMIDTANGTVDAQRATIAQLAVGPIRRSDVAAITAPAFGDSNVLGMDFLSSLSGWSVEHGELVLRD